MAQINLLKQTTVNDDNWKGAAKLWLSVFVILFLLAAGYYASLFWKIRSLDQQASQLAAQINTDQEAMQSTQDVQDLYLRQEQLQGFTDALGKHVYWSQLFPELARVTLKTASYSSIGLDKLGEISITASVPTLADLDKYLQVFNLPEFNKYFSNVRIDSFHIAQSGTGSAVNFRVKMDYDPKLISYFSGN